MRRSSKEKLTLLLGRIFSDFGSSTDMIGKMGVPVPTEKRRDVQQNALPTECPPKLAQAGEPRHGGHTNFFAKSFDSHLWTA